LSCERYSKKKKKKSSTSKKVREGDEEGGVVTRREQADPEEAEYEAAFGDIAGSGSTSSGPPRTKAELKFEEVKRQRVRLLFFPLCRTLLGV